MTQYSKIGHNIAVLRHEHAQHYNQLVEMITHLHRQEAETLRMQTEAAEEHKRMFQRNFDQLAVIQRGVNVVLVQNYELHEYLIPRLFVILPEKIADRVIRGIEDSKDGAESSSSTKNRTQDQEGFIDMIKNWDPKKLLEEKFRLYFLCECGEHSSAELGTSAHTSIQSTANIKNRVHLAKHEGYQLSRPTQFLKQYGPCLLGMLQILKFCLDAAKFVAPAVGIAQGSLRMAADGIKYASEHTLEAVNISIDFLEMNLGSDNTLDALDGNSLGTYTGHVKWVCLAHFRGSYRENAMKSLLSIIGANKGLYDRQLRKITLALTSSTLTKDFMKQLVTYSFAVDELDLTLDFGFGSADLARITDSLAQPSVKILKLDLNDTEGLGRLDLKLPGGGKYRPLLALMSNGKLQQLSLTGMNYFGSRTSEFRKNQEQSTLRSFHHLNHAL
ncbi:hypothetical protein BGX26_004272, partial [Mortierella sp. AD094]